MNRKISVDLQFPVIDAIGIAVTPPDDVPSFIDEVSFCDNSRRRGVCKDPIGHVTIRDDAVDVNLHRVVLQDEMIVHGSDLGFGFLPSASGYCRAGREAISL